MREKVLELIDLLQSNSNSKNITALVIVLSAHILCPIIAGIIIKFFHLILGVKKKASKSAFYGPLKFYIIVCSFGLAIKFLSLSVGITNLYLRILKILTILTIAKALGNSMEPDSTFFTKLEDTTSFNR